MFQSGLSATPSLPKNALIDLGAFRRVWLIGNACGDARRLESLHHMVLHNFAAGDRVIHLGNLIGGHSPHSDAVASINQFLRFRIQCLARVGVIPDDIICLRGAQEEMWQRLLQLQFAASPAEVLQWLRAQGVESTLRSYGHDLKHGEAACRAGTTVISRWTTTLRDSLRQHDGHERWFSSLKRAAFYHGTAGNLLCVAAGITPEKPMTAQGDSFWWDTAGFDRVVLPWQDFTLLIRGQGQLAATPGKLSLHTPSGGIRLICLDNTLNHLGHWDY